MTKQKFQVSWLLAVVFTVIGCGIFLFPAYRFSAYLSFGASLLALCFSVLGLLSRRHGKTARILKTMLIVLLCIFLLCAVVTGVFIGRASLGSPQEKCDYLIVLGAGVNGTVPSLSLRDRLLAAKTYLEANPDTLCIVSGGQGPGESITEARCMADWLTGQGIAESRILLEDKATSTQENIAFSLDLIEARTGVRPSSAGLVSSEYHLFRAGLMAKGQGLTAIGIPADTHRTSLKINYFLREIVAVWYYLILGG